MAETIVVAAAEWIGSLLIEEVSTLYDVKDKVRDLHEELEVVKLYLQDADAKQGLREVGSLIGQIRKHAYDAEDVIDTYILKVESKAAGHSHGRSLMRFGHFLYNAPRMYKVGKQVQEIKISLKQVIEKLNSYGVTRIAARSFFDEKDWKQKRPSYPYDDEGKYVVGLEKDIRRLVEVLVGEGQNQVNVLYVVGMGGSGKTTLAKKLYNHPYINECFDCKTWVFISQQWSPWHVLSEILRKVGGPKDITMLHGQLSVGELVEKIREKLENKSYLVVLDDVWRREALDDILPAFPQGNINRGSKIIITSRNQGIVEFHNLLRNQYIIHEPQPLTEEEGWQLFSMLTLNPAGSNYNMKSFENLGKSMLKQCDGLPLAIVALAGILNTRESIAAWQQVSEAVRSRVMEGTGTYMYGKVGDMLALSYDDLPYYLKPCFLYLGVFPEDCQIPTGMLARMWIAEGLVTAHKEMSAEDVARQHLEELTHRFMVQVVRTNFNGEIKVIRLHDLLRDLCVQKAKEQSFLEVYNPSNDLATRDVSTYEIQSRRAALHSSVRFPVQVSELRSVVVLTRSSISPSAYVEYKEILDLGVVHQNFKLLRLLNLWGIKTASGTLPEQIGSLFHLRYLGIRATNITELPISIENLRNLLTLDYRNVDSDNDVPIRIPNVLWKLVLLRHLFLPIECPWYVEELTLSTLVNLRTLWGLKREVGGLNWLSSEMLKLSTSLQKLKIIASRKEDLVSAFDWVNLKSDRLHTFHCMLTEGVVFSLLAPIGHCRRLHKMVLVGELGMQLCVAMPSNLVTLELKDSRMWADPMEAIGELAHLKFLKLSNSYLGSRFTCRNFSFPRLEELYLENLQDLETWSIRPSAMQRLKKLEILWCMKLQHFPHDLAYVKSLQQVEFFGLPKQFGQEAGQYGWSKKRLRLPNNCDAILEQCDTPIDTSSIAKLYEQLTSGVILNEKTKKYWVIKQNDRYFNCFTLYAGDLLSLRVTDDVRLDRPPWAPKPSTCWQPIELPDSKCDLTNFTMAKDKVYDPKFAIFGEFNTECLSPQVIYEVAYEILLLDIFFKNKKPLPVTTSMLSLPNGRSLRQKFQLGYYRDRPREKPSWTRLSIGEFESSPENIGQISFSLCHIAPGLVVKGVSIQPKLAASEFVEFVEGI